MTNKRKALMTVVAAMLLVVMSVMGTLAYLTSQDAVTNTFTVGNVKITLDEFDYDNDDNKADNKTIDGVVRDKANEYKLIPGHTYVKDPIVRVDANSENCFLYVKVVNEIEAIEDETTVDNQLKVNGWTEISDTGVYWYKDVCGAGFNIPTFTQFKVKGTEKDLSSYAGKTIKVTAYAIQADGFGSAVEAWNTASGEFTVQ